jgi:hypothetical protein
MALKQYYKNPNSPVQTRFFSNEIRRLLEEILREAQKLEVFYYP